MNALTTTRDEGFIWKNNEPMVDGLVTNYDKYLINLIGSQNLFFNLIFCAQDSDKLSDLRPAQLKSLYAEFLGLFKYVNWEDTSKAAARIYSSKIDDTEGRIHRTETRMKMLGDPRADLKAAEQVKARLELDAVDIDMQMDIKTQKIEAFKKISLESRIAKEKLVVLEGERARLQKVLLELKEGAAKLEAELATKTRDLLKEVQDAEKTIENKDEIKKAALVVHDATEAISRIDEEVYILNLDIKDANELITNERDRATQVTNKINELKLDTRIQGITTKLDSINLEIVQITNRLDQIHLEPELVKIKAEIAAQEKSAAVLDDIDPACTSEICGLITLSLEDKKKLPETQLRYHEVERSLLDMFSAQANNLRGEVFDLTKQAEAIAKEISLSASELDTRLDEINKSISLVEMHNTQQGEQFETLNTRLRDHNEARANAKELADQAPLIVIAEARIKDLKKMAIESVERSKDIEVKYLADVKALNGIIVLTNADILKVNTAINEDADALLQTVELELRALTGLKETITGDAIKNKGTLDTIKKEIEQLLMMESENQVSQDKKTHYVSQQSRWKYLRDACSKDGLRALEIEGVAPVITKHANDMLMETFGPSQTVRFQTQDENGKEVLEIIVIDSDGSETMLSDLCGGEKIWVLKALRLAQTRISQEKSGLHFQSLLLDEEDGALSRDNAIRFIKLYRTLMEMAKIDISYYISHRPEAIALADHTLKFRKGGISIL
jgi:hypothetical protein